MSVPIFVFEPHIQKLIKDGVYEVVKNKATGEFIGLVRDKATGKFAAHAIQILHKGTNLNPIFTTINTGSNFVTNAAQMYQVHRGFQKTYRMIDALQQSIGVLQGTMNLIGIGTVASVALSAVNLHQILKLREDVKQLRIEVKNGFIDLKQALKEESKEIIERIDLVAKDVEYRQHRTILAQAYGRFLQSVECIKDALKIKDYNLRNRALSNAQKMLYDALADYKNPLLDDNSNTSGQLRRKECTWTIEQTLIMTYELQGAYETISDRLKRFQENIRQDMIELVDRCNSQVELDFLFPELSYITNHDLVALKNWSNNTDYFLSLPHSDKQLIEKAVLTQTEFSAQTDESKILIENQPQEINDCQRNKSISHFAALKDNLKFNIKPQLRKDCEEYIIKQSIEIEKPSLAPNNWEEISNLTVANLYWYLKNAA